MNYSSFLQNILEAASKIAVQNFGKVSGVTKGDDNNQVLTETDLEIGKLIVGYIQKAYPTHNIIDEEAGVIDNASDYTWVVDPIDGTSNFASGVPTYGIMIGLLHNAIPIAGGIALPSFQQVVLAEKGNGAYCNKEKLSVTTEPNLLNCLVAYHIDGHQADPQLTKEESALLGEIILSIRNLRTSGCEPYDGLFVAQGKYGALLNQTCKIWDIVAPQIIIQEAGGIYSDFWGEPLDYTNALSKVNANFTVCAASPVLHKQLQAIIHQSIQ